MLQIYFNIVTRHIILLYQIHEYDNLENTTPIIIVYPIMESSICLTLTSLCQWRHRVPAMIDMIQFDPDPLLCWLWITKLQAVIQSRSQTPDFQAIHYFNVDKFNILAVPEVQKYHRNIVLHMLVFYLLFKCYY